MKAALTFKSVTLAAYETQNHAVTGKVFVCASATAAFLVGFDGGEEVIFIEGWSYDSGNEGFRFLVFRNPTAAAITITYYAGNGAMAYANRADVIIVKNPATYVKGTGILNDASHTFNGVDGINSRKQIVITNLDAGGNTIYALDASNNILAAVFALTAWTIETSGVVKVSNATGVNYCVGEVFYA